MFLELVEVEVLFPDVVEYVFLQASVVFDVARWLTRSHKLLDDDCVPIFVFAHGLDHLRGFLFGAQLPKDEFSIDDFGAVLGNSLDELPRTCISRGLATEPVHSLGACNQKGLVATIFVPYFVTLNRKLALWKDV